MTPIHRRTALALASATAGLSSARAQTGDFPNKPLRIIVPYTPGGTTDIATRLVAEPLARALGQPVVIENRPGANSILGVGVAATSPPDGHTMVMVLPAHAANATLQAGRLPFDPLAFAPVSLVVQAPLVLAGSRHVPAQNLREYLDYARARPGQVNYGSSGIGATAHLAMEDLQLRTGLRMVHVPYRGTQPALADLMAGHIGMMFDTYSTLKPQFEAGNIRPLGIATATRPSFAAELPTIIEGGLPDFVVSSWCMLLAPPRTPQAIVDRLSAEVGRIVRQPAMAQRLQEIGFVVEGRPSADTGTFLRAEVTRWAGVIRSADVKVDG
ncbi:Bug family tripartite tricarboxylate transporter substrate binding protein [Sediminicoccus rosea]|uniref:Tripartite tricarboxylate transporter substrate binding protein n=1 Tax=Sediminicoccus rosea TaxID=1225128 RepID=A0ABZ0PE79_9PROT|nr:tripartite tricarboxylate transporter substrate binding protein [Sediminicoccus rosea]WPB83816.1 tripartite tricarboxylate transporter substrate binding protein [Sediminicoccus rosea]